MKGRISVVIIAKNEPKIDYTLQSLLHQTIKPYEVIIVVDKVDDISAKISEKYIDKLPIKIVINSIPGYGGARRRGVEEASGDIIAFIDADCIANEKWTENIIKAFSKSDVMVLAGKVIGIRSYEDLPSTINNLDLGQDYQEFQKLLEFAPTLNFAFRRELVNIVGNFDPWFSEGGEDLDFCIRLRKAGYWIHYNPSVKVYHLVHKFSFRRAWRDGKSRAQCFIKHGSAMLSDAFTCFYHGASLIILSLLLALGLYKLALLIFMPSLAHRLYRAIINIKQGMKCSISLLKSFITYVSHVSFVISLLILAEKELISRPTNHSSFMKSYIVRSRD